MKSLHPLLRLPQLFMLALSALLSQGALAHKPSDAYVSLDVQAQRIEQRLDIALRDLDRELDLDANGDGQLTWGEVRRRWPEIEALAARQVKVQAEAGDCTAGAGGAPLLDEHSDGHYAVLTRTLECSAAPQALSIDYTLFARSDPTHRGIVRLTAAPGSPLQTLVLGPQAPTHRFALAASAADAPSGFWAFLQEGLHHIAIGLDHILFLVTLLLVAVWRREGRQWVARAQWRPTLLEVLRLVTAFTVAHSITLGLAAAGVLAPPSRPVESLIAASVLIAAVDNLVPIVPVPRWAMVFLFGLVHGFGFAGPLQDLGLRQGELALPLLGFNLGVELGQLIVVALLLPLAFVLRDTRFYRLGAVRAGSAAIAALAALWLVERAFDVHLLPA